MGFPYGSSTADTKFYDVLEIPKGSSESDIKKAYRRLAIIHHPDKGGDADKFREITRAYEVLTDPQVRARYDAGGEGALSQTNPEADLFSSFFGHPRSRSKKKSEDLVVNINVTLEELYSGCTKQVSVDRKILVQGGDATKVCTLCNGSGFRVQVLRMGPMVQQIQSACSSCAGLGKTCEIREEKRVVDVVVPKGTNDGHRILYRGLSNERLDTDTGDLVVVIKQRKHSTFERRGDNLHISLAISLSEALCGCDLQICHLDGRKLRIRSDKIISPLEAAGEPCGEHDKWEEFEGCGCDLPTLANAESNNPEEIKAACEAHLAGRGVGAIVVEGNKAFFKQCTREDAIAAKTENPSSVMYVLKKRKPIMVKAVREEGMPSEKNPLSRGDLFVSLRIEFPQSLSENEVQRLREILPPALNLPPEDDAEECALVDADVRSYFEKGRNGPGENTEHQQQQYPRGAQCHQQ